MAKKLKFSITPRGEVMDQTTKIESKPESKAVRVILDKNATIIHGTSMLELSELQGVRIINIRRHEDGTIHLELEE